MSKTLRFLLFWTVCVACVVCSERVVGAPPEGSLTLPLAEYLTLLEEAEKGPGVEPTLTLPLEQETSFRIEDSQADSQAGSQATVTATFRVESSGAGVAVGLPFPALVEDIAVEPVGEAGFHRTPRGLVLITPRRGSYKVTVRGRQPLVSTEAGLRLVLGTSQAAMSTFEVDMPESLTLEGEGIYSRGQRQVGERRVHRFATRHGEDLALHLVRRGGNTGTETLARTRLMTVIGFDTNGLKRHEVVHYTVERGALATFEVELPTDFEVRRVATDEGDDVFPTTTDDSLMVERRRRLESLGHLVLEAPSHPLPSGESRVPLAPVVPRLPVDGRYLVVLAAAVELRPLPSTAWTPVDPSDLPAELSAALGPHAVGAIWRAEEGAEAAQLAVVPVPVAAAVADFVEQRESTTFLTADGRLVIRDRFTLGSATESFEVVLPAGTKLWSTLVDGAAVRPLERGDGLVIPLALAAEPVVEVVAVAERALDDRRGLLALELPRVAMPVLEHLWRVLLPEDRRYRVSRSALRPVDPEAIALNFMGRPVSGQVVSWLATRPSDSAGVQGTITDVESSPLPGAVVTLTGPGGQRREGVTKATGRFSFKGLTPGSWKFLAHLEGFTAVQEDLRIPAGRIAQVKAVLPLASVAEELVVVSRSPTIDSRSAEELEREVAEERRRQAAESELNTMARDLGTGVRPLAVSIPETGKLLLLAGALPPERVELELEWRGNR